jgi:hypothetical protein
MSAEISCIACQFACQEYQCIDSLLLSMVLKELTFPAGIFGEFSLGLQPG